MYSRPQEKVGEVPEANGAMSESKEVEEPRVMCVYVFRCRSLADTHKHLTRHLVCDYLCTICQLVARHVLQSSFMYVRPQEKARDVREANEALKEANKLEEPRFLCLLCECHVLLLTSW